eukprot:19558-Amphidinium_carterae.1
MACQAPPNHCQDCNVAATGQTLEMLPSDVQLQRAKCDQHALPKICHRAPLSQPPALKFIPSIDQMSALSHWQSAIAMPTKCQALIKRATFHWAKSKLGW